MKKLLMLGTSNGSCSIVEYAKSVGIYTIVTDNLPVEASIAKKIADEYWMISTSEIDLLEGKCRETGINAVMSGASDYNVARAIELASRLGLPSFCSEKVWHYSVDKYDFKQKCKEFNVPIPEDYIVSSALNEEDLRKVAFPVMVKPVDLSGNKGISYCHNGSTRDEIRGHLEIMSPYFQPPLAGRCSIRDYSLKLFTHAQREEAYCDDSLIGLVAYYINGKYAYVSNVSVLPEYSGKGIASILLNKMESTLIGFGVGFVSMETADNDQSIAFYRKNGYDLDRQLEDGKRRMVKYLNSETPLVSIICLVYNHANYLRECFEGFIMQRVNFPIEILVHDDASTDGSAEIIKEYTNRYPQLFKPIFQTINQYSKGVHVSATYQYPRCRGKYIAVCEGDDYWTDPMKLQTQVSFMEQHKDVSMCFHNAYYYDQVRSKIIGEHRIYEMDKYVDNNIIFRDGGFIPTNSIMYRSELISKVNELSAACPVGDLPLQIAMAISGKVYYINKTMSCYRVNNSSSAMYKVNSNVERYIKHHKAFISWYNGLDKLTNYKFHSEIAEAIVFSEARILIAEKNYKALSDKKYKVYAQSLPITQRIGLVANMSGFGWIYKLGHSFLSMIRKFI